MDTVRIPGGATAPFDAGALGETAENQAAVFQFGARTSRSIWGPVMVAALYE